jgi:hypothetical protein
VPDKLLRQAKLAASGASIPEQTLPAAAHISNHATIPRPPSDAGEDISEETSGTSELAPMKGQQPTDEDLEFWSHIADKL